MGSPAQGVDDPTSHGVTAPFESKLRGRSVPAAFDMMRYAIGVLSRARRAVERSGLAWYGGDFRAVKCTPESTISQLRYLLEPLARRALAEMENQRP